MIISHKYKIIFIHIPKNAGTFITKLLYNLDENLDTQYLGHIKANQAQKIIHPDIWNKYTKFCVIRNSWDMILSIYTYTKNHEQIKYYLEGINFYDYLLYLYNNPNNVLKQLDYILDDNNETIIDYLIDFNNIENNLLNFFNNIIKIDLKTLIVEMPKSKINESKRETDYTLYYNKTTIEMVINIYKEDINFFNFKFGNKSNNKLLWPNN